MLTSAVIKNFRFKVWFGSFCEKRILNAAKEWNGEILVCPFQCLAEVDLSAEIAGNGDCIKRLTGISESIGSTVFCGVKTKILEIKHISAAVCNKGRLIDIVDRTSNPYDDEFGISGKLKIFVCKEGRVGLLVDSDCLIESNWKRTAPHCDIMLCLNRGNSEFARQEVRLFSATYKTPYLYVDEQGIEWHE